jgi:acetoin utilization deacetylase AcuC-like enzyme
MCLIGSILENMNIVFNNKHTLQNVGGRSFRRKGEVQLTYWERQKISKPPKPGDAQENPARAFFIKKAIKETGIGTIYPPKDYGIKPILAVHDQGYVGFLKTVYEENAKLIGKVGPVYPETFAVRFSTHKPSSLLGLKGYYGFDIYTPIAEGTWQAAYWSAQCALTASEKVLKGERVVYAACRPSGHHAGKDYYGGFCYLNNAAIAAQYLHDKTGRKVAILDIDFHHGNGTQDIFYSDPNTLFCSLHGDPEFAFPYFTGHADEHGIGDGEGFNYNWPLPRGTSDALYLSNLDKALGVIQDYHPNYLILSAGFDTGVNDPYGGFQITIDGFQQIGQHIASLKPDLPIVIIQEGGYVPDKLGEYVVALLTQFI